MELIMLSSDIVKITFITIFTYFSYIKIINYNDNNLYDTSFIISVSISIALGYRMLIRLIPPVIAILLLYSLYGLIIRKIIGEKSNYNIVIYIISCMISYAIYLLAIIMSGLLFVFLFNKNEYANAISLLIIPINAVLLFYFVFKIKRFKNGFNFLKNKTINSNIIFTVVFCFAIIMIIFSITQKTNNTMNLRVFVLDTSILIVIWFIFWIKSQITINYKNKMRDRTIEIQKSEIDEQARVMEELKAENLKLASAIHKYNKKFSSLEFAMKSAIGSTGNTEFANELSVILKETKEASQNFAKEVEVNRTKLPETNIVGIDNMFKYMREEAINKNINFDFKLNTSIIPLIETIISKDKLETLIGDHLKDAIIAINSSKETYKSILVTLGVVDGIYEFSVYDTGIEFEIDTLLKLGKEQVTTHKNEGGSGIGFMTTFETLKECKASLVIEEYNPETTNYTKSVTIKFDGKNEYKICSYRAEKIKEQKSKRRIIIEKMK